MKHYIYSVHAISGSKWSKGYSEFYMTDEIIPTAAHPVMSVAVVQIGETEEVFVPDKQMYCPSNTVQVRICRALYTYKKDVYGMEEQKGYVFTIHKTDIGGFLSDCQYDIDLLLKIDIPMDVNDPRYVNWNYQVAKD